MKCQNCGFTNPEDARFCQQCGTALEWACPNCKTPNPIAARFCKQCGTSLSSGTGTAPSLSPVRQAQPGPEPRLLRLTAAAPHSLVEKVRASAHLAGERRIVTVLFADVVGSTALAEQMDPEDWTGVMNRAFDVLTPAIYRYEGTIARLMGDALLAFFGAPVAHEDDPARAARAALDMISAARQFSVELQAQQGIDFAIRVGLNTGPVVVGEVGSNLVYEYTAMGDAVNLAARMQAAAGPMSILITGDTYRLLSPAFECLDQGEIQVKGKHEPVHIYELVQAKAAIPKVRYWNELSSPLVGREKDLSELSRLTQAVQAGLGRVVLVLGEPGIGKSRLITEWHEQVNRGETSGGKPVRWAEGRCLSYGQGLAYHLTVDLLRSLLGSPVAGEGDETLSALRELCAELFGAEAGSVVTFLGHLLSLPLEREEDERVTGLDPQALQGQYLISIRKLFSALASRSPLVIVLEDIHWADPSSIDLLVRLLPLASEAPILFCLASRIERDAPGWRLISAAREQLGASLVEISLGALTEEESSSLASNLLEAVDLPEEICHLILLKAEGNPLFVEEVTRMLIDRRVIEKHEGVWSVKGEVRSADIPDNLQSLLLARIDRLPEDVKHTLRVAAVIGRQFSVRVLEEVLKRQEQVNV